MLTLSCSLILKPSTSADCQPIAQNSVARKAKRIVQHKVCGCSKAAKREDKQVKKKIIRRRSLKGNKKKVVRKTIQTQVTRRLLSTMDGPDNAPQRGDNGDDSGNSNSLVHEANGNCATSGLKVRRKWNYQRDSATNTITIGGVKFSILVNLHEKVWCIPCRMMLKDCYRTLRLHVKTNHNKP